jgi:hypothetical protein
MFNFTLGITAAEINKSWEDAQAAHIAAYEEKLNVCLPLWLQCIKGEIKICIRNANRYRAVRPEPEVKILASELEKLIPSSVPKELHLFEAQDFAQLSLIVEKGTGFTLEHARGHRNQCDCAGEDGCVDIVVAKWKWNTQ